MKNSESLLSPRNLRRIIEWATYLSSLEQRIWTKSDAKLTLKIVMEKKRLEHLKNLYYKNKKNSPEACFHDGEWISKGRWIFKKHYLKCKKCGELIRDIDVPI